MAFNRRDEEKLAKTAIVLTVGNVITSPVYFYSFGMGFLTSVISNVLMLIGFHSIGQQRRGVQNVLNRANNFFGIFEGQNLQNGFYNIIEGGASACDEGVRFLGRRR